MIYVLAIKIILITALILTLILFIPIRFFVKYDRDAKCFVKIGFINLSLGSDKKNKKNGKSQKVKKQEKVSNKTAMEKVKSFLLLKDDFFSLLEFTATHAAIVENISFRLDFGTDSAANTGILTGAVNAAAYSLLSAIHHNTMLKEYEIAINPDFEKECFKIFAECIMQTRPMYIIIVGVKAIKILKKHKLI